VFSLRVFEIIFLISVFLLNYIGFILFEEGGSSIYRVKNDRIFKNYIIKGARASLLIY